MPRMKSISKGKRRGGMQGLPPKKRTSMGVSGKRGSTPSGAGVRRTPAKKVTMGSGSRPSTHGLGSTSTQVGESDVRKKPWKKRRRRSLKDIVSRYNFTKNIGY